MPTYDTTVIPAYGRDYRTAKAAKADWEAGKDFIISNMFDRYDGKPVSCRDGLDVMIRFDNLTKTTMARGKKA